MDTTDIKAKQHVFIIGSKGIPASYGGFETFVDKLTEHQKNTQIKYHVACATDDSSPLSKEYEYHNAHCFCIPWRTSASFKAIFYDLDAVEWALYYIKKHHLQHPIIYILACRIGPFIGHYKKKIQRLGGTLYVNPDGHEWKRSKWSMPVRGYWKLSEKRMVKHADLLICDSQNIEKYILETYQHFHPKTIFIAYGADTVVPNTDNNDFKFQEWLNKNSIHPKKYYLVVGRFVPENNFEVIIREFMSSSTPKTLVLITNTNPQFLNKLKIKTGYEKDSRIKFVGTIYDQELLKKIREQAYGYIHGHEVGGTNPSLLESLGVTDLNLLLDVGFNKEVAKDAALYWNKGTGNQAMLINKADQMKEKEIKELGQKAKERIRTAYNWDKITNEYEKIFIR